MGTPVHNLMRRRICRVILSVCVCMCVYIHSGHVSCECRDPRTALDINFQGLLPAGLRQSVLSLFSELPWELPGPVSAVHTALGDSSLCMCSGDPKSGAHTSKDRALQTERHSRLASYFINWASTYNFQIGFPKIKTTLLSLKFYAKFLGIEILIKIF